MAADWVADFQVVTTMPQFKVLAAAISNFQELLDFPDVTRLTEVARRLNLRAASGVPLSFVAARPRPRGPARRRRRGESDYELRIFERGEVSTRGRSWHDLFNAMVWMTFPLSKAACNARQIQSRVPGIVRTREQDRLTMFDEGGVIEVRDPLASDYEHLVFGHAIFESLVRGQLPIRGLRLTVNMTSPPETDNLAARLAQIDEILATTISDGTLAHGSYESVTIV